MSQENRENLAASLAAHIMNMLEMSQQISDLEEKYVMLQSESKQTAARKSELVKEYKEAKKLLDFCIETNSDPIQTKLTTHEDDSDIRISSITAKLW